MQLTPPELAHVLGTLRYCQDHDIPLSYMEHFQGEAFEALDSDAVNELCEKLNTDDQSTLQAPISVGELYDKIGILQLKVEKLVDPDKLGHARRELQALHKLTAAYPTDTGLAFMLHTVNAKLWAVEDAIRACESTNDFGPKFVELARSVYRLNDHRCSVKRKINEAAGSAVVEVKAYQDY